MRVGLARRQLSKAPTKKKKPPVHNLENSANLHDSNYCTTARTNNHKPRTTDWQLTSEGVKKTMWHIGTLAHLGKLVFDLSLTVKGVCRYLYLHSTTGPILRDPEYKYVSLARNKAMRPAFFFSELPSF